jgi:hypothetical protein
MHQIIILATHLYRYIEIIKRSTIFSMSFLKKYSEELNNISSKVYDLIFLNNF